MKKIAFIHTEHHQNILLSICKQENITLDILFIRKEIRYHDKINIFVKKIIPLDTIPYSWRSFKKYKETFKSIILPEINKDEESLIFTWSIENPLVRLLFNKLKNRKVYLFEDGAGSYMKLGSFTYEFGIRDFLITVLIVLSIDIISARFPYIRKKYFTSWALNKNCFPDYKIKKQLIDHKYYQNTISSAYKNIEKVILQKKSFLFIQQPYVEMDVLSEREYIEIHSDAMMKVKNINNKLPVVWKLHPSTCYEEEFNRINEISKIVNIKIVILNEQSNVEYIHNMNRGRGIHYLSLGSSALYVLMALDGSTEHVHYIENNLLLSKLSIQGQIIELYKSLKIGCIN